MADVTSSAGYDVFLCHNSSDKSLVRELAGLLRERNLRVFLDETEFAPGQPWQEGLEAAIATSKAALVLYGPSGLDGWAKREMRAFNEEVVRRGATIIPVLLPGSPETLDLPIFLREFHRVDLRGGLAGGLEHLVASIRGESLRLPPTSVQQPPVRETPKRANSLRRLIATACAVLVGAGALAGYLLFWPQIPAASPLAPSPTPTEQQHPATLEGTQVPPVPQPGTNDVRKRDPVEFSPGPAEIHELPPATVKPARAEIFLTVTSEPAASIRLLQGKKISASGRSPLSAKLAPGTYDIEVSEKSLGLAKTDRVVLGPGSDSVEHTIVVGKSTLIFNSVPWAHVTVDGKALGETPVKKEVYEGVHTVIFECSNGKKDVQQVTSRAYEEVRVKAKCL